ncbi:MAG: hypothetical protein HBSIN02_24740 [Bacteroidia bacterium]|nr:MAG: hypothetical protein HBSIN02_24740 [Bacteroidia bacterium]
MIEAILFMILLAGSIYAYAFAKKNNREKKQSIIKSEGLLPKPNYLTFVTEKDSATFVPNWQSDKSFTETKSDFDLDIEYENEPIKRFSTTHYTATLDSLLNSVYPLQTLTSIDWNVVNALDFSHKEDLSQYADLKEFVSHHMINLGDGDGWYTRLHGYVAEQVAGSTLKDAGHSVVFPELSNQPGFDMIVDGHLWQVKAGADPQAILDHFEKNPDIPVITTPEMASHFPDNPMVTSLPELDHGAIKDSIHGTMNTIEHGDFTGGLHFPIITGLLSSYREIDLLLSGRTNIASALVNAGFDIAGTGLGGFAGAKAGALLGSVGGPLGTAIGAIIGGIAGALLGRSVTNEMKTEPLKQAFHQYQEAMRTQVDSKVITAREKMSDFVVEKQAHFQQQLEEIEKHFKPLILAEKQQYQSRLRQFLSSFGGILEQIEAELANQQKGILSSINRSGKIRRLLWPTKNDVYYDLIAAWFSSRLKFVRLKKQQFDYLNQATESDEILKEELEKIFSFVADNPFRNEQFEHWLANLEVDYKTLMTNIDDIRRKARIATEIIRKSQLDLIKIELMNTYSTLTKLLKTRMKKVKPLQTKVVNEANKLGINIEPA